MERKYLKGKAEAFMRSPVSWLILVSMYVAIGAAIFQAIEDSEGDVSSDQTQKTRTKAIDPLFVANVTRKYRMNLTELEFTALFRDIESYIKETEGGDRSERRRLKDYQKWLYFCFITITTIGYGDVSVVTSGGKVALIFYALFGIPLMLLVLGLIGNSLTYYQAKVVTFLSKNKRIGRTKVFRIFSASFNILVFIVYILIGSAITSHEESWDYLTALYYWFVTFSTIGYGDFIAYGTSLRIMNVIGWVLFRLVGLALVAGILDSIYKWLSTRKESDDTTRDSSDGEMQAKT